MAIACSCALIGDDDVSEVTREMDASDVVVEAKAIMVKQLGDTQRVNWEILRSWKRPAGVNNAITTETVTVCCMCGLPVKSGQQYVLFLSRGGHYAISICRRNRTVDEAAGDIAILNKLHEHGP